MVARVEVPTSVRVPEAQMFPPMFWLPEIDEVPTKRFPTVIAVAEAVVRVV